MSTCATTSQTVGPFFQIGFGLLMNEDIAAPNVAGEHVTVEGQVLDGDRVPIPDALIEIWQANSYGKYSHPEDPQPKPLHPGFRGYGRVATDDNGFFCIRTIKPGRTPGPDDSTQAPHLEVSVFMRGLMKRLVTRIYFPNDSANATDPVLNLVPAARRQTLIARDCGEGVLRWDVLMQGDNETVFFDV
ncbi:MAG: protocatechuate 3,4-dioxygenase subunit alpha [Acidobacteriaceae bacterium]|nr:protocatechuate 3,4-dioxygenase subunit alpha [Acidobacteriaceae bacterium]